MKNNIPHTPFATRFSGGAKETELRLKSIFQWKKQRPPVWLFVLVLLAAFGCGGLVSCQQEEALDDTQAYHMGLNAEIIEIDVENMILYVRDVDEQAGVFGQRCALDCAQAAREERLIYVDYMTHALSVITMDAFQVGDRVTVDLTRLQHSLAKDSAARAEQVQLGTQRGTTTGEYGPFFTKYQSRFEGYEFNAQLLSAEEGRTFSLYDTPENPVEELLMRRYNCEMAGVYHEILAMKGSVSLKLSARNLAANAAEGLCFESVTIHELNTLTEADFISGGVWFPEEGALEWFMEDLQACVAENELTEYTVVSADLSWKWTEKALSMGPQLGDGRYVRLYLAGKTEQDSEWRLYECFWGEYLGLWYDQEELVQDMILSQMLTAASMSDVVEPEEQQLLLVPASEGVSFCAGYFSHYVWGYELVIGVWDAEKEEFLGRLFHAANSSGVPGLVSFQQDGVPYLLYTANGMNQGFSGGQAGLIRIADEEMDWVWPVQGDVREQTRDPIGQPYNDYLAYWENHLAILYPGGVEIFEENKDYGMYEGSPQQWEFRENLNLLPQSVGNISDAELRQIRLWLEEFGRDSNNPWNSVNDSASWRILSLERGGSTDNCVLLCVSEHDASTYLRAVINLDRAGQVPVELLDWEIGGVELTRLPVEAGEVEGGDGVLDQAGKELLMDYFQTEKSYERVYFLGEEPGEPQEGDLRIDNISYLGSEMTYEATGEAFALEKSYYSEQRENGVVVSRWRPIEDEHYIIMSRGMDGELYEVRGDRFYVGSSISDMILEECYGVMDWDVSLQHDDNPYPGGLALGQWNENALQFVEGTPAIKVLENREPIYSPGDYWDEYTRDGITAQRYYNSTEEVWSANTIDVTRNDFATRLGIRVGSTRAEVETAYPELKSTDYWGKYPEQDYLWYCEDRNDFGPAIIFFFENDTVTQITLINMFN